MNLNDYRVGERLRPQWKQVLERWCAIVEQWCEVAGPDRPWWHLEMSNAGLLSAAAMQCGCASLIESSVLKSNRQWGRSDLWVQFPKGGHSVWSSEESQSFCEFKFSHVDSGSIDLKMLNQACRDAVVVDWPAGEKIGVCLFICRSNDPMDEAKIKASIDQIWNDGQLDAAAWAFPECIRDIPGDNKVFSPGIVMAMKLVGSQSSKDYASHKPL